MIMDLACCIWVCSVHPAQFDAFLPADVSLHLARLSQDAQALNDAASFDHVSNFNGSSSAFALIHSATGKLKMQKQMMLNVAVNKCHGWAVCS